MKLSILFFFILTAYKITALDTVQNTALDTAALNEVLENSNICKQIQMLTAYYTYTLLEGICHASGAAENQKCFNDLKQKYPNDLTDFSNIEDAHNFIYHFVVNKSTSQEIPLMQEVEKTIKEQCIPETDLFASVENSSSPEQLLLEKKECIVQITNQKSIELSCNAQDLQKLESAPASS